MRKFRELKRLLKPGERFAPALLGGRGAQYLLAGVHCRLFRKAGAVAALLSLELGAVLWLQIVVFLAVSIAALVATRPLAHKMLDKTIVPTNADRVLHHTAKVTETIDNENTTGAVYIDGKTWTARSEDGDVIARGSMVTIVRMEGVKLFVRKEREEP